MKTKTERESINSKGDPMRQSHLRQSSSITSFEARFLNRDASYSDSDSDDGARLQLPAMVSVGSPAETTPTFNKRMQATHTFSWRSTVAGLLIGGLIVFQNMYFFLRSGLGFGGAFTAAIVGWLLVRVTTPFISKGLAFSPTEHCYLVTVAVATGGGAIAFGFVGPLLAVSKEFSENSGDNANYLDMNWWQLCVYCFGLCTFGIFLAIPFRKKMILKDNLPFPSGKASAVLITSLQRGSQRARRLGLYLAYSFLPSFCVQGGRWAFSNIDRFPIFGNPATCYGWVEDWSTGFHGAAFLMPAVVPYGMMVGSIAQTLITYFTAQKNGDWYPFIPNPPPDEHISCPGPLLGQLRGPLGYTQLLAIAMFFADGILLLGTTAYQWTRDRNQLPENAPLLRSSTKGDITKKQLPSFNIPDTELPRTEPAQLPSKAKEEEDIPDSWWITGALLSVVLTLILVPVALHSASTDGPSVPLDAQFYAQILFCLAVAPFFGFVVVYTYGTSDQALVLLTGKIITAVIILWNGNVVVGLSLAAVGACLSTQACDTCQVMKTAHILKASPRAMLVGQLIGALGSIPIGIVAYKLFTSAYEIPSDQFSADLAQLFRSIALLFKGGDLPENYGWFVLAGCLYVLFWHIAKAWYGHSPGFLYAPVPFAIALGLYIGANTALDFVVGTCIKYAWRHYSKHTFEERHQAVAAGMISGEGVGGIVFALVRLITGKKYLVKVDWE